MIKEFVKKFSEEKAVTVVFFGDSVTQGYFESFEGMHGTTDYEAVYHNQLKKAVNFLFPQKRFNVINSGQGGDIAVNALTRIDRDVLAYDPQLVVICFGLNDINRELDVYINSLKSIFDKLNERQIPAVFMTPNMLNTEITSPILQDIAAKTAQCQCSGKMDEYMKEAVKAAKEKGVAVCDCYSKWKQLERLGVNTNALLANGINHPRREMHKLFAYELFNTIFGSGE